MAHGLQTELYVRETRPRHRVPAFPRWSGPPPEPVPPRNNWPLAALIFVVVVSLVVGVHIWDNAREVQAREQAREEAREAASEKLTADVASAAVYWARALIERETLLVLANSCRAAWGDAETVKDSTVLEDTDRALGGALAEARLTRVEVTGDGYTVTFDGQLTDGAPVSFAVQVVKEVHDWWEVCGVDVVGPS